MSEAGSATIELGHDAGGGRGTGSPPVVRRPPAGDGFLARYKAEQGKWTRACTFVGLFGLAVWGGMFLYDRLDVFSGDQWWHLLITLGIPLLFMTVLSALAWWVSFTHRKAGDFMIATEGEMKKVSWSSRREVIGSTRVVITITLLMAVLLFVVDVVFQSLFRWIGVLKV